MGVLAAVMLKIGLKRHLARHNAFGSDASCTLCWPMHCSSVEVPSKALGRPLGCEMEMLSCIPLQGGLSEQSPRGLPASSFTHPQSYSRLPGRGSQILLSVVVLHATFTCSQEPRTWSLGGRRLHPKKPLQGAREGLRNVRQRLGQPRPDGGRPSRGLHPVHHPEAWGCIAGLGWQLEPLGWGCRRSFGTCAGRYSQICFPLAACSLKLSSKRYPSQIPSLKQHSHAPAAVCTLVCHLKSQRGQLIWA